MNTGKVLLVTRNAIQRLRHDDIEPSGARIPHESPPPETVRRGGT
jgi:hypothetical protein